MGDERKATGELWLVLPRPELGDRRMPYVTDEPAQTGWWREEAKTCVVMDVFSLLRRIREGTTTCDDAEWLRRYFMAVRQERGGAR